MKQYWNLAGVDSQILRLTTQQAHGRKATIASPVLTVRDVCRRLRKSRRQVYRYVSAGRLRPCAQVLGQWLFASPEVDRCASAQVPRALRRFFWDVRLADLSVEQHRNFILGRLLESGDPQALQWVFRHYPRTAVVTFLKGRGAQRLSRRAWQFWASQLGPAGVGGGPSLLHPRGPYPHAALPLSKAPFKRLKRNRGCSPSRPCPPARRPRSVAQRRLK